MINKSSCAKVSFAAPVAGHGPARRGPPHGRPGPPHGRLPLSRGPWARRRQPAGTSRLASESAGLAPAGRGFPAMQPSASPSARAAPASTSGPALRRGPVALWPGQPEKTCDADCETKSEPPPSCAAAAWARGSAAADAPTQLSRRRPRETQKVGTLPWPSPRSAPPSLPLGVSGPRAAGRLGCRRAFRRSARA